MKKAILYSTSTCITCKQAKQLLELKGYEVSVIVIGQDVTTDNFYLLYPGVKTVPYVVVGANKIQGLQNLVKYLA